MHHPILLAHGFARFDVLVKDEKKYWNFIPGFLRSKGFIIYESNVNWAGSVCKRGSELADKVLQLLRDTGDPKVNILAHSMGGLHARKAMVKDGIADRVASLTTCGTTQGDAVRGLDSEESF